MTLNRSENRFTGFVCSDFSILISIALPLLTFFHAEIGQLFLPPLLPLGWFLSSVAQ